MKKQTCLPRKDTPVANSVVVSVKSNDEAKTEMEEAARKLIAGKSDAGQNQEQGKKLKREAAMEVCMLEPVYSSVSEVCVPGRWMATRSSSKGVR